MDGHAMIAFLPHNGSWCKQDLPHMTLVYAGKTEGRPESDFNALAKDAISAARITGSFRLQVEGVEVFGDDEKVDVLTFTPTPQLLVARKRVEEWNASEFKDFKPHATIGPEGSAAEMFKGYQDPFETSLRDGLPLSIYFNRIGAFWGERSLIFNLIDDY